MLVEVNKEYQSLRTILTAIPKQYDEAYNNKLSVTLLQELKIAYEQ